MFILQKSSSKLSSRQQINIRGVRSGVLMLPNNEYRAVLSTSSINLELRSEAEQDNLIDIYQSFLNALPCPIQTLFRVREMDITRYMEIFTQKLKTEKEVVYKNQIKNYSQFVSTLVLNNKILARSFYVVLPFSAHENVEFELASSQLNLNCDIVARGLKRLGLSAKRLTSLEVLELFYSFYNPEQAKTQPLTNQTLNLLKQAYL